MGVLFLMAQAIAKTQLNVRSDDSTMCGLCYILLGTGNIVANSLVTLFLSVLPVGLVFYVKK